MATSESEDEEAFALAERLKARRIYLGFNQADVAGVLNISRAAVSAIETGRRRITGVELGRLAEFYGTTGDRLLGKNPVEDGTADALFRATRELSDEGKLQVIQFAEFLKKVGSPPRSDSE